MASAENLASTSRARIGPKALAQIRIASELRHGVGERRRIVDRHGQRGLARRWRSRGIPARRSPPSRARRRQPRAGFSAGPRGVRQERRNARAPTPSLISVDVAEPIDADRGWRIRGAARAQASRDSPCRNRRRAGAEAPRLACQARERIDEGEHALVSEHAPDIGRGHRRRRLRQRREMSGVDARAWNEHDLLGRHAERERRRRDRRDSARRSCCASA